MNGRSSCIVLGSKASTLRSGIPNTRHTPKRLALLSILGLWKALLQKDFNRQNLAGALTSLTCQKMGARTILGVEQLFTFSVLGPEHACGRGHLQQARS